MSEHKWRKETGTLKDGMILRMKVANKEHPKYGEYVYALCNGGGFGCNAETMGNAIFTDCESFDLDEVLAVQKARAEGGEFFDTGNRWERFWKIDVLVQDKEYPKHEDAREVFICTVCGEKKDRQERRMVQMFTGKGTCGSCVDAEEAKNAKQEGEISG